MYFFWRVHFLDFSVFEGCLQALASAKPVTASSDFLRFQPPFSSQLGEVCGCNGIHQNSIFFQFYELGLRTLSNQKSLIPLSIKITGLKWDVGHLTDKGEKLDCWLHVFISSWCINCYLLVFKQVFYISYWVMRAIQVRTSLLFWLVKSKYSYRLFSVAQFIFTAKVWIDRMFSFFLPWICSFILSQNSCLNSKSQNFFCSSLVIRIVFILRFTDPFY